MTGPSITVRIGQQVADGATRLTLHAHQEMVAEDIAVDDLLHALRNATVLEEYPEDRRGVSCLVLGYSPAGRPIHVVCTTSLPLLVLITVYEPKPPKWITPLLRRPPA